MKTSSVIAMGISLLSAPCFAAENAAATSVNDFAFDCLKVMSKEEGNIAFSPYSAWSALTMTSAGAAGSTLTEMAKTLHLPKDAESIHAAASKWSDQLGKLKGVQLEIANRLWASPDFTATEYFDGLTKKYYQAGFERVDFLADKEAARKKINKWVSGQTADRIPNLLQPLDVTPDTRLILTNAVYFKGSWQDEFNENATKKLPFTQSDGKSLQAQLMYRKGAMPYFETGDFQAVQLDYAGGTASMIVILPAKGKERPVTVGDYNAVRRGLKRQQVSLRLPRFEIDEHMGMIPLLKTLGIKEAFSTQADFSRMSESDELAIGNVVHQTFVKVAEKGTEAAAATAVVMIPRSATPQKEIIKEMIVDRTFQFFIVDNSTGGILFLGRVNDPGVQ